ncbi:hypothetical protein C1H46_002083 [Malus baccata]|uniref:Uncharacterized protein n=1 Tax=Malus baccata TaxID=106549 RepID=A0A540NPI6_MALBA|nr:hypothetical protein C1H46_002083 [Malus baccata]
MASLTKVGQDGKLKGPTTFQVVAAKIWKARSIALNMPDEKTSTIFSSLMFASASCLKPHQGLLAMHWSSCLVRKVQERVERLDDVYLRSGIDWLEVNRGVPCGEDSFSSLVAWWKLGLEQDEFSWGKVKCATSVLLKPGLVMLLLRLASGNGNAWDCLMIKWRCFAG